MDNKIDESKSFFETKIKPVLQYVGAIGATITVIAYIFLVFVLINGFDPNQGKGGVGSTMTFALITAAIGFIVMQLLKIQGQSFAKNLPENQKILKDYQDFLIKKNGPKKQKLHSITYYWITSVIKDIFVKCLTFAASTISIVWIVIEGTKNYNLLLLALVNILMFICFGLLGLVKTYDAYNEQHINFLKKIMEDKDA